MMMVMVTKMIKCDDDDGNDDDEPAGQGGWCVRQHWGRRCRANCRRTRHNLRCQSSSNICVPPRKSPSASTFLCPTIETHPPRTPDIEIGQTRHRASCSLPGGGDNDALSSILYFCGWFDALSSILYFCGGFDALSSTLYFCSAFKVVSAWLIGYEVCRCVRKPK